MLYPTRNPECAGGAQPVGPAAAAAQWTHTVPSQMPWTLPPSQRPFSGTGPPNNVFFLRQPVPPTISHFATTPTVTPVSSVVRPTPDIGNPMNLLQAAGAPETLSLNDIANLPKTLPRQLDASQQLVVYPGDPCTSSAPQCFCAAGDITASKPTATGDLFSQNAQRQPFPSTSYCAPRFKRKLRPGHVVSDGGILSSSDESSDAVGGKIFITERMVARMGDLSLRDRQKQGEQCELVGSQSSNQQRAKIGSTEDESSNTLFDRSLPVETSQTQISSTPIMLNNNEPVISQQYNGFGKLVEGYHSNNTNGSSFMKQITLEDDDDDDGNDADADDADFKDDQTVDSPLLICSGVKPTVAANSSIEQRLAMEMIKKSTMAVVLWSPPKTHLAPLTPTASEAVADSSEFCNGSNEMEQQESDSASPNSRVPLIGEMPEPISSMVEDVMEII